MDLEKLTLKVEQMNLILMRWLLGITLPILALVVSYSYGYKSGKDSAKVPEKETKIEYVERIVEKEVKVYVKQNVKENTVTTTTKPDGTTIVQQTVLDSNTEIDQSSIENTHAKAYTYNKRSSAKDWRASFMVGTELAPNLREFSPIYGGAVEHALLGPISGGVWYLHGNDKLAGVSVSLEF